MSICPRRWEKLDILRQNYPLVSSCVDFVQIIIRVCLINALSNQKCVDIFSKFFIIITYVDVINLLVFYVNIFMTFCLLTRHVNFTSTSNFGQQFNLILKHFYIKLYAYTDELQNSITLRDRGVATNVTNRYWKSKRRLSFQINMLSSKMTYFDLSDIKDMSP